MVGVPGKSKGCTTCRRRKIRVSTLFSNFHLSSPTHYPQPTNPIYQCDLQEPFCNTCAKSRRVCEGYARFPVFLNRTLQGPEKRHGLEEAKTTLSQPPGPDLSQPRPMLSTINFQRAQVESRRVHDNRILVQPNDSVAFDQQMISALWERYTPSISSTHGGVPCMWLQNIIDLPARGIPLQLAIKAFAMTRIGWINKDDSLILHGNLCYGRALNAVQIALSSDVSKLQDVILAAGYVLSVYEVAFPPRLPYQSRQS